VVIPDAGHLIIFMVYFEGRRILLIFGEDYERQPGLHENGSSLVPSGILPFFMQRRPNKSIYNTFFGALFVYIYVLCVQC